MTKEIDTHNSSITRYRALIVEEELTLNLLIYSNMIITLEMLEEIREKIRTYRQHIIYAQVCLAGINNASEYKQSISDSTTIDMRIVPEKVIAN